MDQYRTGHPKVKTERRTHHKESGHPSYVSVKIEEIQYCSLRVPQPEVVLSKKTTSGNKFGNAELFTDICVNLALTKIWH